MAAPTRRMGRTAALLVLAAVGGGCASSHGLFRWPQEERGRHVFAEKGCNGCHTLQATGTPIAPDLTRIGAKYRRGYLEDWLRDPTAYCPSHMPRVAMSEDDLQALTDYLASLR